MPDIYKDIDGKITKIGSQDLYGKFHPEKGFEFDGSDYRPDVDKLRLTGQLKRVFEAMSDGKWRTLNEITDITGDPQASISAQLRNLRKPSFGSHVVHKRNRGGRRS